MALPSSLRAGSIVRGPTLPEAVEVLALVPLGDAVKIIGRGLQTGLTHDPVLTPDQLARLTISADHEPFDGEPNALSVWCQEEEEGTDPI
jgi:hypothetical protein